MKRICPECLTVTPVEGSPETCPQDGEPLLALDDGEDDPLIGQLLVDRFVVLGPVGRGGMGTVYRAWQRSMHREVALKLLARQLADTRRLVGRFEREARATARLRSPHTVTLFDFGHLPTGELFIAMELLVGRPMNRVIIEDGPLAPGRAAALLDQVCASLEEAHAQGLVHRDVKPGNVFVERHADGSESAKVLDFGLVKVLDEPAEDLTRTGVTVGSPGYMSPEQARGIEVGPAADIYSVGALGFAMLTGRPPFLGPSLLDILLLQTSEDAPPLRRFAPDTPAHAALEAIIGRCLARSLADRFASVRDVREALRQVPRDAEPLRATAPPSSVVVAEPPAWEETVDGVSGVYPPSGAVSARAETGPGGAASGGGASRERSSPAAAPPSEPEPAVEAPPAPEPPSEPVGAGPGPAPLRPRRRPAVAVAVALGVGAVALFFVWVLRPSDSLDGGRWAPSGAPGRAHPTTAAAVVAGPLPAPDDGPAGLPPDAGPLPAADVLPAPLPDAGPAAALADAGPRAAPDAGPAAALPDAGPLPAPDAGPAALRVATADGGSPAQALGAARRAPERAPQPRRTAGRIAGVRGIGVETEAARNVLAAVRRPLSDCLRSSGAAEGEGVSVLLTLAPSGAVRAASTRPRDGAGLRFRNCAAPVLEALHFPVEAGRGFATVSLDVRP